MRSCRTLRVHRAVTLLIISYGTTYSISVPEFIDPVFTKRRPKLSFSVNENVRFGLVFAETGSINSGTDHESLYHSLYTYCTITNHIPVNKEHGMHKKY